MNEHLINLTNLIPEKRLPLFSRVLGMIFLVGAMHFSPVRAGENLLSERIHLKVENVTLKDALKEIEKQSEFTFLYNDASIDVNQTVTLSANELSIKELLDEVLDDKGIRYTIIDNQIVLTKAEQQQENKITVSGMITDADSGEGLPGVTVVEKGTSNGTITDLDGNYTLTVSENGTLQISYVGYITEEVPVENQTSINLNLVPDIISLEDVVIIGYTTVKKSDLTGAVSSISTEEIKQTVAPGIDQAIQGRAAGVSVTSNSGTPGASPTVRIRGMGTITNPDPFYVVDGIPVSAEAIGALNPGDIEDIQILKDASSAAIYGSRAANGVVLITSKKGKAGTSSISFDAYTGVQNVAKKHDLLSAREYIEIRNASRPPDEQENPDSITGTDWQDEIFRKARVSNYQLSFMGGTENISYAVIGSYYDQEGIIKGSDYNRYTLRVNTAFNIKPWLTVGENIGLITSKQNIIPEQDEWTSVVIEALTMDPATSVYNADGTPAGSVRNNIGNPVGHIERNHNILNSNKLLGNFYLELKPVKWITLKSTFGAEITREKNEQFFPVFYESVTINQNVNRLFRGNYNRNNLINENTVTFHKIFAGKHDVKVIAGYTRQRDDYRLELYQAQDVPEDENLWFITNTGDVSSIAFEDISASLPTLARSPIPTNSTIVSYLGQLLYSYGNLFDLTASIRRDGSSRFGEDNRWGNFPSFAAALKIHELPFYPQNDIVTFLKVRGGWGRLGNQEFPDYRAFTVINYGFNYTFGLYPDQAESFGGAPIDFGNTGLKWEQTDQTNIGLDANFLQNKLSLTFDYFTRKTIDMLCEVPIPGITGVQRNPVANAGSVENMGVEFTLNFKERRGDFSYNIGFNIASIKNNVTSLGGGDYITSASFRATNFVSRTEVGQPIASFYGYVTDGYWQNQDEIDAANQLARESAGDPESTSIFYDRRDNQPGDYKFKDLDGDNRITSADRDFIGNPHPKLIYGANINLTYKIVDLQIFGQGVSGNKVFQATKYYLESGDGYWNMMPTIKDYWEEEGDQTTVPRLGSSEPNLRISDRYVEKGDYFRIKNIQLGVTLPGTLAEKIHVERLRVYVAAQNAISFHKYKGFDPEIGQGATTGESVSQSGTLDIGIDRGMYPLARTYNIGVNLTF